MRCTRCDARSPEYAVEWFADVWAWWHSMRSACRASDRARWVAWLRDRLRLARWLPSGGWTVASCVALFYFLRPYGEPLDAAHCFAFAVLAVAWIPVRK